MSDTKYAWETCSHRDECINGGKYGKGCHEDKLQSANGGRPWHECSCGIDADGRVPTNTKEAQMNMNLNKPAEMTDAKTDEAGTPLTVEILADALSCFWNAALGAAHNQQAGFDVATIMVEGVGAVANRLSEYSKERITRADLLADMTRQRDELWDLLHRCAGSPPAVNMEPSHES